MAQEGVQLNRKVFTVKYRNQECKIGAMRALNAVPGISARINNSSGLLRGVEVTLTGSTDFGIPRVMLGAFGTLRNEKAVFTVTFRDATRKRDALAGVNALKGVVSMKFDHVDNTVSAYGPTVPSTLNVYGEANPRIVLGVLRQFGTARFA